MRYLLFFLLALPFLGRSQGKTTTIPFNPIRYVNPFIGTDGTGHTFPGPSYPFGLVQPGPDNADHSWAYTSGYQYKDTNLLGFSQTRLSGTGIPELGDVLLLPFTSGKESQARRMLKSTEKAQVGYYSVKTAAQIQCEMTCTPRVALHRYRYPKGTQAALLLDQGHGLRFLNDSLVISSTQYFPNKRRITGWAKTRNWVKRYYAFCVELSSPWIRLDKTAKTGEQTSILQLHFGALPGSQLLVKVALSTTGIAGAEANLQAELPHWNFEKTVANCQAEWKKYLQRISLTAPDSHLIKFYTAYYHLLLQPANIADVDGRYRGADDSIRISADKAYYSTLSIWDIYRTAFPLLQKLVPERIPGILNSILLHHEAAGFLPIWTAWGQDNYCMIGNHSIPMLVGAWKNGFLPNEGKRILRAITETSFRSHPHSDWGLYLEHGFYPYDKVANEAVSRTLETCLDDASVAWMAEWLGDSSTAQQFRHRASFYRNLYDAESRQFRGKDSQDRWRTPFDPLTPTSPLNNPGDYTEANAWQYFWTPAQHDFPGLVALLGGKIATEAKLDSFFSLPMKTANAYLGQEGLIGQYAHGNEPGHHVPWLYALLGKPEKSKALIRRIVDENYGTGPNGLLGNDDCGQLSAWLMAAYLGMFPISPANNQWLELRALDHQATIVNFKKERE